MKAICLAVFLMAAPLSVFAANGSGWNLGLALMYQSYKTDSNGTTSESTQTDYDIKFGYLMTSGLYLGVIYDNQTHGGGGSSYPTRTGYGAVVGYHTGNWTFDLDYYLSSTRNSSATTSYTGGTNMQVDIGYDIPLSSSFYLGWQLAYRMYAYNSVTNNGTSSSTDFKMTEIQPLIRLGFNF